MSASERLRLVHAREEFKPSLGRAGESLSRPTQGRNGDVALLLYAAPFILSFVYALYLWAQAGLSATLPSLVYIQVTQSPYIFLAGFAAVALACVIDFSAEPPALRKGAVLSLSRRLQGIAFLALFLAVLSAWYAAGFDVGTTGFNLLDGRYALVFPALLVFFSFVILPSVKLQGVNWNNLIVIVLLIASPAAVYELGKRNVPAGLGVGLILLLVAAFLLVRNKKN
jgi:hypothetical protein